MAEGMAAGCACIGSDVVGLRELISHEQDGLLVPEGDAEALARALRRVIESPEWARQLSIAARQKAERDFDLSLTQSRYMQLFRRIA